MLREQFAGHAHVKVRPIGGDPPDRYRVEYLVGGLERKSDGSLVVRRHHEIEIVLPAEYPRQPAACRMLTPVFHPNIDTIAVCTSDFHTAQETLIDLIVRVGQMIAFQKHNVKSPLNAEAAVWCEENRARLPVDPAELYPPTRGAPPTRSPMPPKAESSRPVLHSSVPPLATPPTIVDTASTDDVDTFLIQLLSPHDPSVPPGGVSAKIGEVIQFGSLQCMLVYRLTPVRLEIRSMRGGDGVALSFGAMSEASIGSTRLRVLHADRSSLARLGADLASAPPGSPALVVFWNGIAASQVTLTARAQHLVEVTAATSPDIERVIAYSSERVSVCRRLRASSPASPMWKERLAAVAARLEGVIRARKARG